MILSRFIYILFYAIYTVRLEAINETPDNPSVDSEKSEKENDGDGDEEEKSDKADKGNSTEVVAVKEIDPETGAKKNWWERTKDAFKVIYGSKAAVDVENLEDKEKFLVLETIKKNETKETSSEEKDEGKGTESE